MAATLRNTKTISKNFHVKKISSRELFLYLVFVNVYTFINLIILKR
ncbi:hypothetical protein SAMN05421740_102545 [Parapedobacter koreensis]|uniref:Uncharacterized protein n=1 Tax=Parapedobacter koreensis TaxID=332977 RepID=A0A1H7JFN2_9SPHI|nr:hypothetical protein SAMN05421740_102545 [Parapedobacter koreensis]